MNSILEPGMFVTHPGQPEWGVGQVQSVTPDKITVMFPDAGKVVIDAHVVSLELSGHMK